MARDRVPRRIRNRVAAERREVGVLQGLAPPLQADLSHHGLTDESRNARDLAGKGGECDEIPSQVSR